MSQEKYYNGVNVLNNNCPISFLNGNRSIGKTFFFLRQGLNGYFRRQRKFIYLRRTGTELEYCTENLFDDVRNKFPEIIDTKTVGKGRELWVQTEDEIWNLVGYGFSLSESKKLKSIPLSEVDMIFFDEYLPDDLHYLKPAEPFYEPQQLLNIYLTVARGYGKPIREDVKLICCANTVSVHNPYFSYFGIDLTQKNSGIFNNVYAESIHNKTIADEIEKSKFGQIIKGTRYGNYALGNESLNDTNRNIKQHSNKAFPYMSLFFGRWYTVYYDNGDLVISNSYDRTFKKKYQLSEPPEDGETIPLLTGKSFDVFRKAYQNDTLYFEDLQIKSALYGIFKRR